MNTTIIVSERAQWADRIRSRWQETVDTIIEIGQLLMEAKAALVHGEFEKMVQDDLGWSPRTARCLMAVAKHPMLSNRHHGAVLPNSWRTLYELSRIPRETLKDAFESGLITPDMQRKDIGQLRTQILNHEQDDATSITCTVDDLQLLIDRGVKVGTVYADPPWQYGNQGTRAATDRHYVTMPFDEIVALPIPQLVSLQSHLHLWTTNGFLPEALELIKLWGFEYKGVFVWVKPEMGIGNYWRVSHEFMLLGVRGNCHFRNHSQQSWIKASRAAGHSTKPAGVRAAIEKVSPNPRLELFAREDAKGWIVWGKEISQTLFAQSVNEISR